MYHCITPEMGNLTCPLRLAIAVYWEIILFCCCNYHRNLYSYAQTVYNILICLFHFSFTMKSRSHSVLLVGGLHTTTTGKIMQRYFQWFGRVCDSVVIRDHRTSRSLGFGYVRFCDAANIGRVLNKSPHVLDGR